MLRNIWPTSNIFYFLRIAYSIERAPSEQSGNAACSNLILAHYPSHNL
jgi:hypothetical protein